jgi:hypothetical protein
MKTNPPALPPGPGRPPGARNRFSGQFLADMANAWQEHECCGMLETGDFAMTAKKPTDDKKVTTIDVNDPDSSKGALKTVGGSRSDHWNNILLNQAANTLWIKHSDEKTRETQCKATMSALIGIARKDEIEGMIATQLIAAHNAAMESYRRAMIGEQSFEGRRENLGQANKLSRTYAVLLDALNKHRGKGQQKVTVEHVHVHSGGQAVVGVVETPGVGNSLKSEAQHNARQIAHAPQPAMRSPNPEREFVSIPSDAERPMPDAWGKVSGSSEGQ